MSAKTAPYGREVGQTRDGRGLPPHQYNLQFLGKSCLEPEQVLDASTDPVLYFCVEVERQNPPESSIRRRLLVSLSSESTLRDTTNSK